MAAYILLVFHKQNPQIQILFTLHCSKPLCCRTKAPLFWLQTPHGFRAWIMTLSQPCLVFCNLKFDSHNLLGVPIEKMELLLPTT